MMNEIVLFGQQSAAQDAAAWKRWPFDRAGEIVFRLTQNEDLAPPSDSLSAAFAWLGERVSRAGGLAIALDCAGNTSVVRVVIRGAGELDLPSRVATISFGGQHAWRTLIDKEWTLEPWDAVVIPVSASVEQALHAFLASANDLPPTSRDAVFLQLTKPALESRVARIEQYETMGTYRARHEAATQSSMQRSWLQKHAPMAALVAAVASVITVIVLTVRSTGVEQRAPSVPSGSAGVEQLDTVGNKAQTADGGSEIPRTLPNQSRVFVVRGSTEDRVLEALDTGRIGADHLFPFDDVAFSGGAVADTGPGLEQLRTLAAIVHAFPAIALEIDGVEIDGSQAERKAHWDETGQSVTRYLRRFGAGASQLTLRRYPSDNGQEPTARNRVASFRIVRAASAGPSGSNPPAAGQNNR
jgi:hypothetical protein